MPQIANQDYNVIRPAYANTISNDAEALGQLAGHIERGTIFDVVLAFTDDDQANEESRISGIKHENGLVAVYYCDMYLNSFAYFYINYTPTQYSGLAAVQKACELTDELPALGFSADENDRLAENNSGKLICVDGKLLAVESDLNDQLKSITLTEQQAEAGTFVNISFEDAQKLIGLPIA